MKFENWRRKVYLVSQKDIQKLIFFKYESVISNLFFTIPHLDVRKEGDGRKKQHRLKNKNVNAEESSIK